MTTTATTTRELAHRTGDGVEVTLLWEAATDRVAVAVSDSRSGESFEVEVRREDRALDVFEHPYVFAALRGVAAAGLPVAA